MQDRCSFGQLYLDERRRPYVLNSCQDDSKRRQKCSFEALVQCYGARLIACLDLQESFAQQTYIQPVIKLLRKLSVVGVVLSNADLRLFGSRGKHSATIDSDFDVAVVGLEVEAFVHGWQRDLLGRLAVAAAAAGFEVDTHSWSALVSAREPHIRLRQRVQTGALVANPTVDITVAHVREGSNLVVECVHVVNQLFATEKLIRTNLPVLTALFKELLKKKGFWASGCASRGFTSATVEMMVIAYLSDRSCWPPKRGRLSTGQLFVDMLNFYGRVFDPAQHKICAVGSSVFFAQRGPDEPGDALLVEVRKAKFEPAISCSRAPSLLSRRLRVRISLQVLTERRRDPQPQLPVQFTPGCMGVLAASVQDFAAVCTLEELLKHHLNCRIGRTREYVSAQLQKLVGGVGVSSGEDGGGSSGEPEYSSPLPHRQAWVTDEQWQEQARLSHGLTPGWEARNSPMPQECHTMHTALHRHTPRAQVCISSESGKTYYRQVLSNKASWARPKDALVAPPDK